MSLLASLSKLKSLFPVIVVGASVAITIKLLTESSPTTSNIFQVSAMEDILETNYQEELQIPEPEVEPQPEEVPPPSPPADEESKQEVPPEDKGEQQESNDDVSSKVEEEDKKVSEDKQEQEKPKNKPMKFRDNELGKMFSAIFKGNKK